jgi:hypothetical protein
MVYELIEKQLAIANALTRKHEFKKAYTLFDRVLRLYSNDFRAHEAYAGALEDEWNNFADVCECPEEKLRKARTHRYFVLRHSTDFTSAYVYRALKGLLGQARLLGKGRYAVRLEQTIARLDGTFYYRSTPRADVDFS